MEERSVLRRQSSETTNSLENPTATAREDPQDGADSIKTLNRILNFRDWLRGNAEDRDLYERTKRDLAEKEWADVQKYDDAKTSVIEEILARNRYASKRSLCSAESTGQKLIGVRKSCLRALET